MSPRKILLAILVFLGVAVVATVIVVGRPKKPKAQTEEVHYHAGFRVYIDGRLQDYSAAKYMNIEPCTTGNQAVKEDDQAEKAHLHDGVGDVVHVHRNGAVWGDLFKNIHVRFDPGEKIVGYSADGLKIPNILSQPIKPYESVVIVVGDQSEAGEYIKNAVTIEHIKEVESKSETCGAGRK